MNTPPDKKAKLFVPAYNNRNDIRHSKSDNILRMNIVPRNCKKSDLIILLGYTYLMSGIFTVQPHCLLPKSQASALHFPFFSLSLLRSSSLCCSLHIFLEWLVRFLFFFWLPKTSWCLSHHSGFYSGCSCFTEASRVGDTLTASCLTQRINSIRAHLRGASVLRQPARSRCCRRRRSDPPGHPRRGSHPSSIPNRSAW